MKKFFLLSCCIFGACQATPKQPQSFDDLLKITDTTQTPICTLPLTQLQEALSPDVLKAKKAEAFDFTKVIETYKNDPATQIRILFRRAALKRRLNVENDNFEIAQGFYDSLSIGKDTPTTLKGFHDGFHYLIDRISEQSEYGGQNSAAYNLRFCVMNEKRAELHAASRRDILARMKDGVNLPAPELIENINHETSFDDGFTPNMFAKLYTTDTINTLTPLERAKIRADKALLPFDPKTAENFWQGRDEEIKAMIDFIQSHDFSPLADKLTHMTQIDQSLRKLFIGDVSKLHFEDAQEYQVFNQNLFERVTKVDNFNTAELEKMLKGRAWFRDDIDGKGAAHNAWLIAQHADLNPDFQQKVLSLIEADLDAPGVSKSNYAYLYDRVQVRYSDNDALPKSVQRYGTQGLCTGPETWEPFPVEFPDRIDAVRAEVGLETMAEYKSRFKTICTKDDR